MDFKNDYTHLQFYLSIMKSAIKPLACKFSIFLAIFGTFTLDDFVLLIAMNFRWGKKKGPPLFSNDSFVFGCFWMIGTVGIGGGDVSNYGTVTMEMGGCLYHSLVYIIQDGDFCCELK